MTTHIAAVAAATDLAADAVVLRRWADRAHGASIVDPARLRVPDAPVADYRDNRWPLAALGDASRPTIVFEQRMRRKAASMGWRDIEPEWREPLKRLGWLMINQPVPDLLLTAPGHNYVTRPGAGTIASAVANLAEFLRWLRDLDDITEMRQVNDYHLGQWVQHLHARNLMQPNAYIRPLTYLWAWGEAGELPAQDVLIRPFWIGNSAALGTCRHDSGEGRQPLSADTMDPLIWWAVEFVERFSPDCLTALRWRHDLAPAMSNMGTEGNTRAASAWLRSLPEHPRLSEGGEDARRDVGYLIAISPGLTHGAIQNGLRHLVVADELPPLAPVGAPKPIPVATTAQINGRPWLQLDWRHVASSGRQRAPLLWTVLQGACAVVIGYLGAGPRPLELRTLTRGCLQVQHLDAGTVRYLIHGRLTKQRRDDTDQQSRNGIEHIWPALTPEPVKLFDCAVRRCEFEWR